MLISQRHLFRMMKTITYPKFNQLDKKDNFYKVDVGFFLSLFFLFAKYLFNHFGSENSCLLIFTIVCHDITIDIYVKYIRIHDDIRHS